MSVLSCHIGQVLAAPPFSNKWMPGVRTMLSIAYNLLARQKRGFGPGRLPALQEDNHEEAAEA